MKWFHPPGTMVLNGLIREFVESSGINIGIDLGIPLFIEIILQPVGDLSRIVHRNCLQSLLDFNNRAHTFNDSRNVVSGKEVSPFCVIAFLACRARRPMRLKRTSRRSDRDGWLAKAGVGA